MNSQIQAEIQQLKVYLDQYPYEAAQGSNRKKLVESRAIAKVREDLEV